MAFPRVGLTLRSARSARLEGWEWDVWPSFETPPFRRLLRMRVGVGGTTLLQQA
jgi:hypothetical protein